MQQMFKPHICSDQDLALSNFAYAFLLVEVNTLGPFPLVVRQLRFLLVMVDYFTKWVEVKVMANTISEWICHVYWKNII